jgi:hypothetical protein
MPERVTFCDPERLAEDYLNEFLAEKRVPQNLFYLLNGASSFYSYRSAELAEIGSHDELRFFRQQPFWSPACQIAFVSLGCGNAGAEKPLLQQMHAEGCGVRYVGVDSSESMLELAAANLTDSAFPQTFALADFGLPEFPKQVQALVRDCDARIFAMMGGTFGNFEQTMVADLLARVVPQGAYLYLDVVPMYGAEEANHRLRARFSQLPENLRLFFDRLLSVLGLAREDGEIFGVESDDGVVSTIRYTFYFRPLHEIMITCLGEEAVLTPEDRVELISIRAYEVESLQAFMNQRGFATVGTYVPDTGNLSHLWQRLLFVKED